MAPLAVPRRRTWMPCSTEPSPHGPDAGHGRHSPTASQCCNSSDDSPALYGVRNLHVHIQYIKYLEWFKCIVSPHVFLLGLLGFLKYVLRRHINFYFNHTWILVWIQYRKESIILISIKFKLLNLYVHVYPTCFII